MVSNAWYTVNYYHVSFGKQDQLQRAIGGIKKVENLPVNASQAFIFERLTTSKSSVTQKQLWYFNGEVPHRFLSPWFSRGDKNEVYRASQQFENKCLYALFPNHVEVSPYWAAYLQAHASVLKDFCYWNLSGYLQAKNPNVPGIPNKLCRPLLRNTLLKQRREFWDVVIREKGSVNCIYTNKPIEVGNYALDHFIPYSFVAHDLIWNLVPADQSFNSIKSDKLPNLDENDLFDRFFDIQQSAVEIIRAQKKVNRFLEDYLVLFSNMDYTDSGSGSFTKANFRERLQPLITIAANNGFEYLNPYSHPQ